MDRTNKYLSLITSYIFNLLVPFQGHGETCDIYHHWFSGEVETRLSQDTGIPLVVEDIQ